MSGYDEQTRVNPQTGCEVYGQDGYGWYCDRETIEKHFPRAPITPSLNPLFFDLDGMTAAKLRSRGFIL